MKQASIELSEYDPEWRSDFEAERVFLLRVIGNWFLGGVEHTGSTAVPGLVAKPVIDIMFGVKSLEESRPAIDVLTANGYVYYPYKKNMMHWFCKPSDAFRKHHLHLVPYESPLWKQRIQFRDILRSSREVAHAYAALKKDLATRFKEDREAYTDGKWPFIKAALERVNNGQQD